MALRNNGSWGGENAIPTVGKYKCYTITHLANPNRQIFTAADTQETVDIQMQYNGNIPPPLANCNNNNIIVKGPTADFTFAEWNKPYCGLNIVPNYISVFRTGIDYRPKILFQIVFISISLISTALMSRRGQSPRHN